MIASRSKRYIIPEILLGLILLFLNKYSNIIIYLLSLSLLGLGLFMIWFFRDPKREININPNHILAAADGKIIYIKHENNGVKIATRMSPFDVHLNRAPIKGQITKIIHSPGSHRSVYFAGAEEKNERNLIIFENENAICEVLQLTGAFARRIEIWYELSDLIDQGDKFGMIRFGSQTNVLINLKEIEKDLIITVKIGDQVKAGLSVIAEIKEKNK